MRDKLAKLIFDFWLERTCVNGSAPTAEQYADYLIANGVTFATDNNVGDKWISVRERLPEIDGSYLVRINSRGKYYKVVGYCHNLTLVDSWDFEGCNRGGWFNYDSEVGYYEVAHVTHWMPIPQTLEEREMNDQRRPHTRHVQ